MSGSPRAIQNVNFPFVKTSIPARFACPLPVSLIMSVAPLAGGLLLGDLGEQNVGRRRRDPVLRVHLLTQLLDRREVERADRRSGFGGFSVLGSLLGSAGNPDPGQREYERGLRGVKSHSISSRQLDPNPVRSSNDKKLREALDRFLEE